jgi:hypothetical protein
MHQKDLVKQAWERAGLYRSKDAKLRQFLAHFENVRTDCWPELAAEMRGRYPEYLDVLVQPLWDTGDKLVRVNLLRLARLDDKRERALVDKVIAASDPRTDAVELRTAVLRGDATLAGHVAAMKGLDPDMRRFVARRQAEIAAVGAPVHAPKPAGKPAAGNPKPRRARGAQP